MDCLGSRVSAAAPLQAALRCCVVALDDVDQLGSFAEIEQIVSDLNELETAKETIQDVASRLGLAEVQPVSYLGMLLAKLGIE